MDSGAPILVLPDGWKIGPVGDSIVVAWNGGREALRAVHDAMPLLKHARKVTVFAFSARPSTLREPKRWSGTSAATASKPRFSDWTNTEDISAVDALFASVDEQESDLVVTGAFGHSRLYEGLFGGVSFDLLRIQLCRCSCRIRQGGSKNGRDSQQSGH